MRLKFAKHPPHIHLSNLVSLGVSLAVKVITHRQVLSSEPFYLNAVRQISITSN